MARRPFSKSVHAKEERNGPPSADQGLSTAKPRNSHVTLGSVLKPAHLLLSHTFCWRIYASAERVDCEWIIFSG